MINIETNSTSNERISMLMGSMMDYPILMREKDKRVVQISTKG